jgi:serine/threonine protein kinase
MTATPQQMSARRYRIERYLTEGGMGAIYVGKKLGPGGFEKEVVLKQLLPEYTARPEFRDLFFREAKISATLDHANIVHTFDLVESDESLFIVMEYVRGVDLRTIIRRAKLRRRELSTAAALHITLEVLAGLAYAHNRRAPNGSSMAIIHRDVSPSNILCSAQGEVKLSDFGIAKAATHSSAFYRVRGKVGYMSPEQARSEPVDHRTDLYSVAVCLYEALTAERLFVGDLSTPADVIYAQPIVPPSQKRKGLPAALDVVLVTALAPKPENRYQDSVAFADALRQVAHRHGLLSSAPQLAEHLRYILGGDSDKWLTDERPAASGDPSTQKLPAKELEGKEAASIGVVEAANLYVVSGTDVVSLDSAGPKKLKSDPRGRLPAAASAPPVATPDSPGHFTAPSRASSDDDPATATARRAHAAVARVAVRHPAHTGPGVRRVSADAPAAAGAGRVRCSFGAPTPRRLSGRGWVEPQPADAGGAAAGGIATGAGALRPERRVRIDRWIQPGAP